MNVSWAGDIARLTTRAKRAYIRFFEDQRDKYIQRLEDAGEIPTVALVDIHSLRSFCRDEKPSPSDSFMYWVRSYITYDSEQMMMDFREIITDFMTESILIAGAANLAELELDMEFDYRDTGLLRWLQERSLREVQLIQGVTDEWVLQTLWDTVFDQDLTIKDAAKELSRIYAFSPSRAETVARTEIIGAARSGQYFSDKQSGIVIGKKWRSAKQERTRKGHREADGQIVAFDEPFYVANGKGQLEPLMFPSDGSMGCSADNLINCRCFYTRILEGEEL